jgi:hypothetical protein
VSELSSVCVSDLGYVYPDPPSRSSVIWRYEYKVVSYNGPAQPSLASLMTRLWLPKSRVMIVVGPTDDRESSDWVLVEGPADPSRLDPVNPGHVIPSDYNPTSNNKHWEKIE